MSLTEQERMRLARLQRFDSSSRPTPASTPVEMPLRQTQCTAPANELTATSPAGAADMNVEDFLHSGRPCCVLHLSANGQTRAREWEELRRLVEVEIAKFHEAEIARAAYVRVQLPLFESREPMLTVQTPWLPAAEVHQQSTGFVGDTDAPPAFHFELGEHVEARCEGWGEDYFACEIQEQLPDGRYSVCWAEDPSTYSWVVPEHVRRRRSCSDTAMATSASATTPQWF